MSTSDLTRLRIRQLDETLGRLADVKNAGRPRRGWIREIRRALRMTTGELAKRMGMSQPAVTTLEQREAKGSISLASLEKAADALNCDVVYALIPRSGLQRSFEDRLRQIARDRVSRVAHTMALEEQGVSDARLDREVEDLVQEMLINPPRNLW